MRRILKNTGYLFSATGISAGLSMLQGILAARLLGVAGFGVLGAITMFTSVLNKFASFRMDELVIRYVSQFTEERDFQKAAAVFKAAALAEMLASLAAFGLIWVLSPAGARYLAKDENTATWFVVYGAIVLVNLIAESSSGLLQVFDRYRRMAGLNIGQSLFTLAVIGLAYLRGAGMMEVLLAYIGGKAIGALGLTLTALKLARQRWGAGWQRTPLALLRPHLKELARFAISTNISATINLVNKDSELLWISFFRSPTEAGYYKLAVALSNLVQLPVSPLPQVTYPELTREVTRRNWGNVRDIMRQGSFLAGAYSLGAAAGLLLFGQWLIQVIYKPEYLPAYPALLILLAGFLFDNIFYWRRTALLSLDHPDFPAKLNTLLAIIKVAGILLLVPRFGYLASAGLLAGFYIVGSTISVWKVRRLVRQGEQAVAPARAG